MATIVEALALAVQHHQAGRLAEAEKIYLQVLQAAPGHPDALHLLGVSAAQGGRHEQAIACIRQAIVVQPANAAFHNNLGNALREQRKLDEAAAAYRRALELKPDYAEAHNNLGNAFTDQGKLDEAAASYRRALELQPGYAEAHNNLGIALRNQGKPEEAAASCRRALELKPGYAEAHSNLGHALMEQGKLNEAAASYRRALELRPGFAEAHNNLGMALRDQGKLDEAVASCRRALELKPDYAEAHNNLGHALREQEKPAEAVAHYEQALRLRPDFAEAHLGRGLMLAELGELDQALACYRAALRHEPRQANALAALAKTLGARLPHTELAAAEQLLEGPLSSRERATLQFGVAHVFDAREEYARAAALVEKANAYLRELLARQGAAYDPHKYTSFVNRVIAVFNADYLQRVQGWGLDTELPVFIVGLPRSGTTLTEQILAGHARVFGAGELTYIRDSGLLRTDLAAIDRAAVEAEARRYLERVRPLAPAADRIIDKMPENYHHVGLLAMLFPRARIIHCRRDVRDTALSCWMTGFTHVSWASDLEHLAGRIREYQRLMNHWRDVLPQRILEIDYEETVADLEGVARRLVSWCGLDWDPACLAFHKVQRQVRTASAAQVRQPIYTRSVQRWKHYEQLLAPLLASLKTST